MSEYVASRSELIHESPVTQRVDPAHDMMRADSDPTPWLALAGRDPERNEQQLDRQTSELLAYIQYQNREVDERQSELNAKLAQLDHLLRTARLQKGIDVGHDLLAPELSLHSDAAVAPTPIATHPSVPTKEPSPNKFPGSGTRPRDKARASTSENVRENRRESTRLPEFDDVEKVVAEIADLAELADSGGTASTHRRNASNSEHLQVNVGTIDDQFSLMFGRSDSSLSLRSSDPIDALASSLEADALQSEKRLLAERKLELDRRKAVLQRMQDETQTLHREAIEMRLVTEQLWAQLTERVPTDRLNQLFASLRERLQDQYADAERLLVERKSELEVLRSKMQQKQHELREQSQKLQAWVESRHEEIKGYAAQLDAREVLLDRREHRLQDEFARWEAQRRSYKEQLSSVLQKINLAPQS